MNDKLYGIAEIFTSVQGEGHRVGTLNHFIRFAGCNLDCNVAEQGFKCDTDFKLRERLTVQQIIEWCRKSNPNCDWCVLTGGEPALQVDRNFIDAMHEACFKLAIETNGTVDTPLQNYDNCPSVSVGYYMLDWITVSPKRSPLVLQQLVAHEVKYVVAAGEPIPSTPVKAQHQFISPAFDGLNPNNDAMKWCVGLVHANPEWRLSLQSHKFMGVR